MALISKEDLLKKFESGGLLFQPEVRKLIEEEPEAVVRCKDCEYADKYHQCEWFRLFNARTDFCSRGKRHED